MNRCKFVARMFAPYCCGIKIQHNLVVVLSFSNFNRRTLCGSCETARRYAAAGCTYKVGNLSRYITSFIRRPSPRCCFITWPPISERLAASPKVQLWPVVTEGPKVFPKLGAGREQRGRLVGGRCHTQYYGQGFRGKLRRPMLLRRRGYLSGCRTGECNLQKLFWRQSIGI